MCKPPLRRSIDSFPDSIRTAIAGRVLDKAAVLLLLHDGRVEPVVTELANTFPASMLLLDDVVNATLAARKTTTFIQ